MSLQGLLNLGKTAQLKICKTLQAEVRALCPCPGSAGGDLSLGCPVKPSDALVCVMLVCGVDSQSATSNRLYAALSPKSYGC